MLLHFIQKSPGDYVSQQRVLQVLGISAEIGASLPPQVSSGLGRHYLLSTFRQVGRQTDRHIWVLGFSVRLQVTLCLWEVQDVTVTPFPPLPGVIRGGGKTPVFLGVLSDPGG